MPWLGFAAGLISTGIGAASKAGAFDRGGGRGPQVRTIPLPPYADALNRYIARLYASNLTNVPPSFVDYIKSGGTATFPLNNVGLSPLEARQLGTIDRRGNAVPFVDPQATSLSPEQKLFLGYQLAAHNRGGPIARGYLKMRQAERLTNLLDQAPNSKILQRRQNRIQQLTNQGNKLFDRGLV